MDNRFSFKDFIFVLLFVTVIAAVVWVGYQYSYQEGRLNDVKKELVQMGDDQKQQLEVLADIRTALKAGVRVSATGLATTQTTANNGRIRRRNPDGSIYVYYPTPPTTPHDPSNNPDYSTGDWLVQAMDSEPKVIAPYIEKDYMGQLAQGPVMESLLTQNMDNFQYEPYLAESYYESGDGLLIRFKLRAGINFSDGTPITAEDVVFSYNTLMNPGVDSASERSFFEHVKSCVKVDERTVEFHLDEPYFLALGPIGIDLVILPEHVYKFKNADDYNHAGDVLVGSGPYMVDRWDRGQQLVMVRNNRYWGERATFDRLVFKFITNEQAAFQAFEDGQIDQYEPSGDQYEKFSQDPEFLKKFISYKYLRVNSGYGFIAWNLKRPMFKDKETRTALTMLLDRDAMIDTLLKKMGVPTAGPFVPISPQSDPDLKPLPYDPEGAKKLLAAAGWQPGTDGVLTRNGVRFQFDLSMGAGSPTMDRVANYIKNQYATAGIRMNITPWEFAVLQNRLDDRNFDAVTMSWMGGGPEQDPYQIWDSKSMADKGSNIISWDNKQSDQLIEEARRTMDDDKRLALWHKWEALIANEQPYTFLWVRPDRLFVNGRFKNTEPYKLISDPYDWYVPAAAQKYK